MGARRADLGAAPGVTLSLELPDDSREEGADALPAVDLGVVPGATLALLRGFRGPSGVVVRALCARAPSDRWAPGVEELVLGRASAVVQLTAGGDVEGFEAAAVLAQGARFEQGFRGALRRGDQRLTLVGRHLLGFTGPAHEALLCSVVCTEPEPGARCAGLVMGVEAHGAFTEAPPPSFAVRGLMEAAGHPVAAGLGVAALFLVATALILARRPRPRW